MTKSFSGLLSPLQVHQRFTKRTLGKMKRFLKSGNLIRFDPSKTCADCDTPNSDGKKLILWQTFSRAKFAQAFIEAVLVLADYYGGVEKIGKELLANVGRE